MRAILSNLLVSCEMQAMSRARTMHVHVWASDHTCMQCMVTVLVVIILLVWSVLVVIILLVWSVLVVRIMHSEYTLRQLRGSRRKPHTPHVHAAHCATHERTRCEHARPPAACSQDDRRVHMHSGCNADLKR
jgi:hypothetical protein